MKGKSKESLPLRTWCRLELPAETETKSGDRLNGLNDAIHDECWRHLEANPQNGGGLWAWDERTDSWHIVG